MAAATLPLPPGNPASGSSGTMQNEAFYEGLTRQEFGAAAAAQYATLYAQVGSKFPATATASSAYQVFAAYAAALATGIGAAAAAKQVLTGVAGVASTAATTTANLPFSGVLSGLFQANIWLRIGEVVFGVVLVAIGLNAMLKGKPLQVITNPVGQVSKLVPK